MSQHATPAYKRYLWTLASILNLYAQLHRASASMRRKLSPPQQIAAIFGVSTISLSFAALWVSTSQGGEATEIISRVRWIPIFCLFRAWDQAFRRGSDGTTVAVILLFMGAIYNCFSFDMYMTNFDVFYCLLVDTVCLLRNYWEFFNKVFEDAVPEGYEDPDNFRLIDLIFLIASFITGFIGIGLLLWLGYRGIYSLYYFPPLPRKVESAQGILAFLWLFGRSVEAHLLITGIMFMMDLVNLITDLMGRMPLTADASSTFLSKSDSTSDFSGLAMDIAGRMRQIFDMLLVGHLGLRFSGNTSKFHFYLAVAALYSGWLFNCLLEAQHERTDDQKEKVETEPVEAQI